MPARRARFVPLALRRRSHVELSGIKVGPARPRRPGGAGTQYLLITRPGPRVPAALLVPNRTSVILVARSAAVPATVVATSTAKKLCPFGPPATHFTDAWVWGWSAGPSLPTATDCGVPPGKGYTLAKNTSNFWLFRGNC